MASMHHGDCPEPRAWIRHPAGMAIDVQPGTALTCWRADVAAAAHGAEHLRDISLGGLACYSRLPHTCGEIVSITIPCTHPPFEVVGRVVWCVVLAGGFDLGVQFMHQDDAFAARMVEQICHIERYRQEMLEHHGREMDSETAAREWIEKFAADFPDPRALH